MSDLGIQDINGIRTRGQPLDLPSIGITWPFTGFGIRSANRYLLFLFQLGSPVGLLKEIVKFPEFCRHLIDFLLQFRNIDGG